jgi:hypothetical protein
MKRSGRTYIRPVISSLFSHGKPNSADCNVLSTGNVGAEKSKTEEHVSDHHLTVLPCNTLLAQYEIYSHDTIGFFKALCD